MTVFADTSALAKLYADEEHSDVVRAIAAVDELVISALSRVELASAIWGKHRDGLISAADAERLARAGEVHIIGSAVDEPSFGVVDLRLPLLGVAADLVARHGLRTGDSIQLASAVAARTADPGCDAVLCFDRRLRDAAAREGFTLLPAEL